VTEVSGTFEIGKCVLPSRLIEAGEKTADVPSHLTPLRFGGQQCSWKTVKTELDFGSLLFDHQPQHRRSILRAEAPLNAS
jgi:hypothetical protein